MEAFEGLVRKVSKAFEWAGVVGILCIFSANIVDVVGAKFFKWPLPGALELISFSQVLAIAPAIAFGLFLGTHLRIDFLFDKFPRHLKVALGVFVSLLCFLLSLTIFVQATKYAYSLQRSGEIGSVSKLPLFPFAYVFAFSLVPVMLFFAVEMLTIVRRK